MALKELQKQVDDWINQYEEGYWDPKDVFLRLGEELGEVSREINHLFGPKQKKKNEKPRKLGEEIADMIFTLVCLANSQKINLDDAFQKIMKEKCYGRDKDRFKKRKGEKTRATLIMHHDDPPCNERLRYGGYCEKCGLYPDTQSKCLYSYCPRCDVMLENMQCPNCKETFEKASLD